MVADAAFGQPAAQKQTLYYIPHTHWEGAVFFTREEYLEQGLSHILTAIHLLENDPDAKFTLDQVAYFRPFLERYPEHARSFRRLIAEGRLQLVGGMDVMPDDVKPGGELFIRQVQYGKGYCRRELGVEVDVAWMVDTFGHHPQMPQLLALSGYTSFWFCRGVPRDELPSEFFWRGIDGTKIPAVWVPGFYGLFYGPPRDPEGFARFFTDRFNALNIHTHAPERVGLAGVDVSRPEEDLGDLIRGFNARPEAPFVIRCSVPGEFAKVVAQRSDTPTLDGDFNPIFQGTYSSRIELHQDTRRIEHKLLTAEKLAAVSRWLGSTSNDEPLWRAWEPLLFNQTHDLASGVMTDIVYEDTVRSNAHAERLADDLVADGWNAMVSRIDTSGAGTPIVVFNPQGWPRTELVEIEIGSPGEHAKGIQVLGPDGPAVPVQVIAREDHPGGDLRHARICFVARDVPAMGYCTYRVVATSEACPATQPDDAAGTIENEFYRLSFDPKGGQITSILDKSSGREVLAGPANIIARQKDEGDLWEMYHHLDGGMYIAATTRQPVPDASTAILSSEHSQPCASAVRGPVYSEFRAEHALADGAFETTVRLVAGVRRIDIQTRLVNNQRHVRYQAIFPTAIKGGTHVQEIPFGAVERPMGVEYPAQNWVDISDDSHGVALLNRGLAGNVAADGTLMLSLLRSENLMDYNFGRPSDTGFELGVPRTLRYSLVPHAGDWRAAGIARHALDFNCPLIARKAAVHGGDLPARLGLVEISDPSVVLTALKPGPDSSVILRVYESSGRPVKGALVKLHPRIIAACEANLLEDPGRNLSTQGHEIRFDLHPFEILTARLTLEPLVTWAR